MAFPKLGKWLTVEVSGHKVSGTLTVINIQTQRAYLEKRDGTGSWVPMGLIRAKYGT